MSKALQIESTKTTPTKNKVGHPGKRNIIPIELLVDMYVRKKMNVTEIAKALNLTHGTVSLRLSNAGVPSLDQFKANRSDIIALKQANILNSFNEIDIKKMQPRDKIVSFGILYDKERLERGLSTSNVSMFSHIIESNAASWGPQDTDNDSKQLPDPDDNIKQAGE